MLSVIKWILINLDGIATLIPIAFIVKYWKSGILKELFPVFIYLHCQFTYNVLTDILSYDTEDNYWIYHASLPLSLLVLCFYFKGIKDALFYTPLLFNAGIILSFFFVINSLILEKPDTLNSYSYLFASLYIIVICLNFFWHQVKLDVYTDVLSESYFWIVTGLFIYYSCAGIIFYSYRFFIKSNDQYTWLIWRFQNVMFLIMNLLILKGIYKQKQKCQTQLSL